MNKNFENLKKDTAQELRRLWREEGGKRVRVYERIKDPLQIGREVIVQRSSGELEGGWKISGFENDGHIVIVEKKEGSEILQKKIPVNKLERLNPTSF